MANEVLILYFLIDFVDIVFEVMYWLVIVRVLLSWIPHDPYNPIIRFIYDVTEVVMAPVRNILPLQAMGIDFSPIVVLILLQLTKTLLINLIIGIL
ncbi:MAG: YggT family protein [Clostridia bacterium]|nr:YggT family protein [Clostridia bacterium]